MKVQVPLKRSGFILGSILKIYSVLIGLKKLSWRFKQTEWIFLFIFRIYAYYIIRNLHYNFTSLHNTEKYFLLSSLFLQLTQGSFLCSLNISSTYIVKPISSTTLQAFKSNINTMNPFNSQKCLKRISFYSSIGKIY